MPVVVLAWIQVKRSVAAKGEPTIPDSARSDEWLAEHRGKKPTAEAATDASGGKSASSTKSGASGKGKKKSK